MVMPLYDDNPFRLPHRPLVTWTLIVTNLFVLLVELAIGNPVQAAETFGLTPALFVGEIHVAGVLPPIFTPFTYMFLHADVAHLFGNMVFLWVFGDDIEEALGRWRFLGFYLFCGILAGLGFVVSDPHAQTPLIGASGAISGVVIAYVMLRPCAKITALLLDLIPVRISAYWVIGTFVLVQFINLEAAAKSEVAYWCHVAGMVSGAMLFPAMRPAGVQLFECIRPPKVPVLAAGTEATPGAPS
jgi:membrane associated rhomboid family serine protease